MRRLAPAVSLLLALATTGCDQLSKHLARTFLAVHGPTALLSGTVALVPADNPGAFLGLGGALPAAVRNALFVTLTGAALLAGAAYLVRKPRRADVAIAAALLVGGGLGNLVDRVMRGGLVSDFLLLRVGPLHTGVFNVADMAITAGALLLAFGSLFSRRPPHDAADLS